MNKSQQSTVHCVPTQSLEGIATLTNDPLATYSLHGKPSKKGSRK